MSATNVIDDMWTVTVIGQGVQPPLRVRTLAATREVVRFLDSETLACYEILSVQPTTLTAVARFVRIESMV